MKLIIKLFGLFVFTLLLSSCSSDSLPPEECIAFLKQAEASGVEGDIPSCKPYIDKDDVFVNNILGGTIDLTRFLSLLKYFGFDASGYVPPTIDLLVALVYWYALMAIVFSAAIIIIFVIGLVGKSFTPDKKSELLKNAQASALYFGFIFIFFAVIAIPLMIILSAINNATSSNFINMSSNNLDKLNTTAAFNPAKPNTNAELLFAKKLEEVRTSRAKAVRFGQHIMGEKTDLDGNDRLTSFSDFAEYQTKMRGFEYSTNISKSVGWLDFNLSWGLAGHAWNLLHSKGYVTGVQIYGKMNEGWFSTDNLNYPTSNFSISLSQDTLSDNDDFRTNSDDSASRRNLIVSAMDADITGMLERVKSLQAKIAASLKADSLAYTTDQYLDEIGSAKQEFESAFSTVQDEIKSIPNQDQRIEIATSYFSILVAKSMGLTKDNEIVKVYDWLDKPAEEWLSVNCTIPSREYELRTKALARMNAVSGSFYHNLSTWGDVDRACVKPAGNKFISTNLNASTDSEIIKEKSIAVKSHAQSIQYHNNIMVAAAKEAFRSVAGNISNAKTKCLKYQLTGWFGLPAQIRCVNDAKHQQDMMVSRLENAITIDYQVELREFNNFIDGVAVFGTPGTKNYVSESDQQIIVNEFKPIPFHVIFDRETIPTGNYVSMLSREEAVVSSLSDKFKEELLDAISGPLYESVKYSAALPVNMTIQQGLAECRRSGCPQTIKPSFYESSVTTGRKMADAGLTCVAIIASAKAVNSVLDFSEGANAAGSAAIGRTKVAAKNVGKTLKIFSASAAAAAETAQMPCYLMLGVGIINGSVLPSFFEISLVFPMLMLVVSFVGLMFIAPIAPIMNVIDSNGKYLSKLNKYIASIYITMFLITAGIFLTLAILLMPSYWLMRPLLSIGFSSGAGFIQLAINMLVAFIMLGFIFKWATGIIDNFIRSILSFYNMHLELSSAHAANKQLATALTAAAAGNTLGGMITRIAESSTDQLKQISNAVKAREEKDRLQQEKESAKPKPDDLRNRGKALDDDKIDNPKPDK